MRGGVPPDEADFGALRVVIRADTLEELFVEAAREVSRRCGRLTGDHGPWQTIRLVESNRALLLVDWLNELIRRSAAERRSFDDVLALRLHDGRVTAEVRGRAVEVWTSPLRAAITEGLRLDRDGSKWKAEVSFDASPR
jgi:SHS2 domain-containing protein